MLLHKTKHISNLLVGQRRLPLAHLPRELRPPAILLKELLRRYSRRDRVVRRIKDLKPQTRLLNAEVAHLPEIPRVDIRPCVPLSRLWLPDMLGKVARVLMRLDHIPDDKYVDIDVEPSGETPGDPLASQL